MSESGVDISKPATPAGPPAEEAAGAPGVTLMGIRLPAGLHSTSQTLVIFLVFVAMCIALSVLTPDFATTDNMLNIARQVSLIVIVGCGMTFVLTTAGLDISIGSVLGLSGAVAAGLAASGWPLPAAFMAATLLGGGVGLVHGGLIVYGSISPFITTLGTMFALRGLAYIYTKHESGGSTAIVTGLPDDFTGIGQGYIAGVPTPVVIAVGVAVVTWLLYNRTLLGRYARAIGGNREAAYLSGLRVNRALITIYVLIGLLAGLSGVILASRLASGQPGAGSGFEFDVLIAVIVGGTSLFGGRGTIVGTVIGALIIGTLGNGLNLLDIDAFWQQVVKGTVLIAAVLVDTKLRRRAAT